MPWFHHDEADNLIHTTQALRETSGINEKRMMERRTLKNNAPRSTITDIVLPPRLRIERVKGPRVMEESGACIGTKREFTFRKVIVGTIAENTRMYFDNNVACFYERDALPSLAHANQLA
jgi:hypothetical protein